MQLRRSVRSLRPRRRATLLAVGAAALFAATLTPIAANPDAAAKTKSTNNRAVVRFPSADVPDEAALSVVLQNSSIPTTIIVAKGTYKLTGQLFVFNRSNVVMCGATGRAGDVTFESPGGAGGAGIRSAVFLQQSSNITFRDMTIRGTAAGGQSIFMDAALSTTLASFCESVTLDGCKLEADNPVVATAAARALTVKNCRIKIGATDGFGILWGDGDALLVSKTKITTASGVDAFAGILVLGATAAASEGERAARIILTRNRIEGAFARAIDLADVLDARLRKNTILLSGDPIREGTTITGGQRWGRVGILVRRGAATALPSDYELRRNKVRGALHGIWLSFTGQGVVSRNDLRRCGSPSVDEFFGEFGGALRLQLQSAICRIEVERNDMRNLRSPKSASDGSDIVDVPAVTVVPGSLADACFADGDGGNRVSNGRVLFLGADE